MQGCVIRTAPNNVTPFSGSLKIIWIPIEISRGPFHVLTHRNKGRHSHIPMDSKITLCYEKHKHSDVMKILQVLSNKRSDPEDWRVFQKVINSVLRGATHYELKPMNNPLVHATLRY